MEQSTENQMMRHKKKKRRSFWDEHIERIQREADNRKRNERDEDDSSEGRKLPKDDTQPEEAKSMDVEDGKQELGNEEMVTDMDDIQTQEIVTDSEGEFVPYTRRGYRDSGKNAPHGK